jgi:hypothetical protein
VNTTVSSGWSSPISSSLLLSRVTDGIRSIRHQQFDGWRQTPGMRTFNSWSTQCSLVTGGPWEPQAVPECRQTWIPGWSNFRVNLTNAVGFRCTRKHLGMPANCFRAPTTTLRATWSGSAMPVSASNILGSTDQMLGSTDHNPGSTLNYCRAVWETHLLWEYWCRTYKS